MKDILTGRSGSVTRRGLVIGAMGLGAAILVAGPRAGAFVNKREPHVWNPEASPSGPVVIIVSLTDQKLSVYRNGIRIGTAPVSTGKPGHRTPTGVFTILQKDVHHHSSKYNNASMPYTERLTWSGVALHAGGLPGYPESHGCVHLSDEFAKLLFSITHLGTVVIIADENSDPAEIVHPGPVLSPLAKQEAEEAIAKVDKKSVPHPKHAAWHTSVTPAPSGGQTSSAKVRKVAEHGRTHLSILISGADQTVQVWNGPDKLLQAPVTILDPGVPLGTHVFTLLGSGAGGRGLRWSGVSIATGSAESPAEADKIIHRAQMSDETSQKIVHLLHPGATMMITDRPASEETQTAHGFTVIAQK